MDHVSYQVTRAAALSFTVLGLFLALTIPSSSRSAHVESIIEPLKHSGYTESIAGSTVQFEMMAIPGGTFLMGSPRSEKSRAGDEGPQHQVQIRPFWMGKTEVTWDEYELFQKNGPTSDNENEAALAKDADAITRPTPPYPDPYRGFGWERHPVVGISHHAAMEYCHWLTVKTGKAYRLPTEAEWEFACRAGTRTVYAFGDDPGKLGDHAWFAKNSQETTHPVAGKKPNPWGLYDMYGNVAEWCLDQYGKDDYGIAPADRLSIAPVRLPSTNRFPHLVRGGSWEDDADKCRSAARRGSDTSWNRIDPDLPQSIWWLWNADFVGFRIVRAVEEQDDLKALRSKVTKQSK